jgi:hypothetical protein
MRYLLLIAATVLCTFHTAVWAADPVLTVTEARRGEWTFGGLADPAVELDGETGCDVIPWAFSWHAVPGDPGRTRTTATGSISSILTIRLPGKSIGHLK